MVLIEKHKTGKQTLTFANIGDTRCVLRKKSKTIRMTTDHKANNPEEKKRVVNSGGHIKNNRVNGSLAITRAFGDFFYKKFGVISLPEISVYTVEPDDRYLLIASDGLWDIFADQAATDLVDK